MYFWFYYFGNVVIFTYANYTLWAILNYAILLTFLQNNQKKCCKCKYGKKTHRIVNTKYTHVSIIFVEMRTSIHCIEQGGLKVYLFLKNILGKIISPKNSQKNLPRWYQWNQWGSFYDFLSEMIFPSTDFNL